MHRDACQVSITFDPFMYLSLPLPARKRRFDVHVLPMRGPATLVCVPAMGLGHTQHH